MKSPRLLLCRPQGGLNDMLNQIEACCRHGDRFGRTVIVDTAYPNAPQSFNDLFSNYFVSTQPDLILDPGPYLALFDRLEVVPGPLRGRVNGYVPRYQDRQASFVDALSGTRLSFDLKSDYPEPLLVHHDCGGGKKSLAALTRLRLHDKLADELVNRLMAIGEPYTALHVRNTDYTSEYQKKIQTISTSIRGPVFVATDDPNCVEYAQRVFGRDRVFTFTTFPAPTAQPLHRHKADDATKYIINSDSILDLLMLALARNLYLFRLNQNDIGATFSGFSLLAGYLQHSGAILDRLIGRHDPVLERCGAVRSSNRRFFKYRWQAIRLMALKLRKSRAARCIYL